MDAYTGRLGAMMENKLSYVKLSAAAMQNHGMATDVPLNPKVGNLDNVNGRFSTITRNAVCHPQLYIHFNRLLGADKT